MNAIRITVGRFRGALAARWSCRSAVAAACLIVAANSAATQGITLDDILGDGTPVEVRDADEEMKVADSIRAAMAETADELKSPGGELQGDHTWAGYHSEKLYIVVFLKGSRDVAAEEWEENQEARTMKPALKHEVTWFRSWNATYTGEGLLNWVEGRFRIHFSHQDQADLDELKREAEVFLAALGRHGAIEDWWSGPMMMCQDAKMRGPDGTWTDLPQDTPFDVEAGTELLVGDYLVLPGCLLDANVPLYVTIRGITETDSGHRYELDIRPKAEEGVNAELDVVTLGRNRESHASRIEFDGRGDDTPVALAVSRSELSWMFSEYEYFWRGLWASSGSGPKEGYTGYETWAEEMAKRRSRLEEWSQTLEAQLPEPPPGEWDLSVTAEDGSPLRVDINSAVQLEVESDGTKRVHVFEGRVDGTHLDSGKRVVVREGQRYETKPGGAPGEVRPLDPDDVPDWWGEGTVTPPADDGQPQPVDELKWVYDAPDGWSTDEGSLYMKGTGAYKKRWALLDSDLRDFTFEVDIRKLRGDGGKTTYPFGLLVRADETGLNSYELGLTSTGKFRISRRTNGKGKAFVDWEKSAIIEEGGRAWNTIKVVSKGDLISFYANGEHLVNLKTVAEGTYKRGRVGVFAVDGKGEFRDMVEFCEFVLTTP